MTDIIKEPFYSLMYEASEGYNDHLWQVPPELLQKYSDLIVRECAELSVNSQYANTKSEYYEGFNEALIYAGNKILEHFGVEL